MAQLIIYRIPAGTVQDYKKETSGRCHYCNSRYIWQKRLAKLPGMTCPFCGRHLHATTHLFKGDTYRLDDK